MTGFSVGGSGSGNVSIVVGTPITLTGTSTTFTAPANAVFGIITPVGLSTNGTSVPLIQLGDVDGYEATGYESDGGFMQTTVSTANYTTGFGLNQSHVAASVYSGIIFLARANPLTNTWNCTAHLSYGNAIGFAFSAGTKSLSNTLTGGRFIMANGTDSFDAGSFNTLWVVQNV